MTTITKRHLTADQEAELREYFSGGLEQVGGMRSSIGPMLDRMRFGLFVDTTWTAAADQSDAICAAVRRERVVRERLSLLQPESAAVLRAIYSPIPQHLVWGLGTAFGSDEAAAAAALRVEVSTPGDGRWQVLHELVARARGNKKLDQAPSTSAQAELTDRAIAAKLAIKRAREAYVEAIVAVAARMRDHQLGRFSRSLAVNA